MPFTVVTEHAKVLARLAAARELERRGATDGERAAAAAAVRRLEGKLATLGGEPPRESPPPQYPWDDGEWWRTPNGEWWRIPPPPPPRTGPRRKQYGKDTPRPRAQQGRGRY